MESKSLYSHAAALAIGLVIGVIVGREYFRYEVRQTFQAAAEGVRSGFNLPGAASSGPARTEIPSPAKAAEPAPVLITLTKKGFRPQDLRAGVEDAVTFNLTITNRTNKSIRAFDGVVTFTDLLDNEIISSKLAVNDPLPAGQSIQWSGELGYNQFIESHQRFRGAELQNMKLRFVPRKILYSDGTEKDYE